MSDNDEAAESASALKDLISSLHRSFPTEDEPATAREVANLYAALAAQLEVNVSILTALVTSPETVGYKASRDRALKAVRVSSAATAKALQGFIDKRASDLVGKDGENE